MITIIGSNNNSNIILESENTSIKENNSLDKKLKESELFSVIIRYESSEKISEEISYFFSLLEKTALSLKNDLGGTSLTFKADVGSYFIEETLIFPNYKATVDFLSKYAGNVLLPAIKANVNLLSLPSAISAEIISQNPDNLKEYLTSTKSHPNFDQMDDKTQNVVLSFGATPETINNSTYETTIYNLGIDVIKYTKS